MNHKLLYILTALTALVFVLFWTVGFDTPYDENPDQNAPLLTDAVLVLAYVYILAAVALTVWAVVRTMRNDTTRGTVNGVPTRRIARFVAGGTALLLAVTFLLTPSTPLTVNGAAYTDTVWLKASGMFVTTSAVMAVVAVAATTITRFTRRRQKGTRP